MSKNFQPRILSFLLLFAALCTTSVMVIFPLQDYDTFWHLANGRAMFASGQIVNSELFSYITDSSKTFHNHEWLSQVVMFLFYSSFGTSGLFIYKIFLTIIVCGFLFATIKRQGSSSETAAFLCIVALFVGINRYEVRPHLFSFLGVAALAWLLYEYREGRISGRTLMLLPIIFTVWNSFHTPVYGLGFLAVFTAGETVKIFVTSSFLKKKEIVDSDSHINENNELFVRGGKFLRMEILFANNRGMTSKQLKVLLGWVGVTVLALLVNPDGLFTYQFFIKLFSGSDQMLITTGEFTPPDFSLKFFSFWSLMGIVSLIFAVSWYRIDLTSLLLVMAFAFLAIKFQRAIPVFCLVTMPIIAKYARFFPMSSFLRSLPIGKLLLIISIGGVVYWKFLGPQTYYTFGTGVSGDLLPVGSAKFVNEVDLQGNMFNTDRYGGYLSFWVGPKRKIFHYNIPAFFNSAQSYFHRANTVIDEWNINYAIVGYKPELDMFRDAGFVPVYWEAPAAVLVKNIPANKQIIDRYRIRYFRPLMDPERFRSLSDSPTVLPLLVREIGDYLSFRPDKKMADLLGEIIVKPSNSFPIDDREKIISDAQKFNDNSALLMQSFAIILYQQKKIQEAKLKFQRALVLDKKLVTSRLNLAYISYDLQDFNKAESEFTQILKENSDNSKAIYGLALTYFSTGEKDLARKQWHRYLELVPEGPWAERARSFLSEI